MKSLEELKAIRDKMKGQIGMRSEHADNTAEKERSPFHNHKIQNASS